MPKRDSAPIGAPCWIDLMSTDTDASRAFYEGLFGWTSEEAGEEYGGYINFLKDGRPIAGCMANQPQFESPDGWSVYLAVADAKQVNDAALANGGQSYVEPMDVGELGTMGVVADAGGAAIGLWQPAQHQGFAEHGEPNTPSWFELFTRDHAASVAFYETVFGWTTSAVGDSDEFRYSVLVDGEEQLAGIMDAGTFLPEGVPAHWSVYFGTADTDATLARIGELGGSTVVPAEDTPYGRLATAADPTGAIFKLVQPPA